MLYIVSLGFPGLNHPFSQGPRSRGLKWALLECCFLSWLLCQKTLQEQFQQEGFVWALGFKKHIPLLWRCPHGRERQGDKNMYLELLTSQPIGKQRLHRMYHWAVISMSIHSYLLLSNRFLSLMFWQPFKHSSLIWGPSFQTHGPIGGIFPQKPWCPD